MLRFSGLGRFFVYERAGSAPKWRGNHQRMTQVASNSRVAWRVFRARTTKRQRRER